MTQIDYVELVIALCLRRSSRSQREVKQLVLILSFFDLISYNCFIGNESLRFTLDYITF